MWTEAASATIDEKQRTKSILSLMVDDELGKRAHQSLHKHELTSHSHLFPWYITEIRTTLLRTTFFEKSHGKRTFDSKLRPVFCH